MLSIFKQKSKQISVEETKEKSLQQLTDELKTIFNIENNHRQREELRDFILENDLSFKAEDLVVRARTRLDILIDMLRSEKESDSQFDFEDEPDETSPLNPSR